MAKEVVITSVPRGIKLGRTGFQVVMRTAGTVDQVMSSLEQLAGYRHVHPQGSGRNPVIYSYRCVRGNTGTLNVLGRTLDAGNDFSNRSNKLAHLIVVDPAEVAALRGSSPAAVLGAIEARLASVWQGGPEERSAPLALPGPAVQATACRRWHTVKGDAGWGGLLAQRALRGQASLVIAPDCSPTWCRTLLELFHEVLALLPPDSRWRTTFETTVIGPSSSLLRGTYAGSAESSTGHAGLLVVDLSQRAPLPANVATDEFITLAREGPRQVAGPRPPRIPGGSLAPASAGMDFDALLGTSAAGPVAINASGPPKAPDAWGDDDVPKSRVGWWILGGTLLLGLLLTGTVIGVWQWWTHTETRRLLRKIETYADIANGRDSAPGGIPALKEWQWVFRDDPEVARPREEDFLLLLSALRTPAVTPDDVRDTQSRNHLIAMARKLTDGDRGLSTVAALGTDITSGVPEDLAQDVNQFVALWLTKAQSASLKDISSLQAGVDAAKLIALAALDEKNGDVRKRITLDHLRLLGMEGVPPDQGATALTDLQNALEKESISDWTKLQAAIKNAMTRPSMAEVGQGGTSSGGTPGADAEAAQERNQAAFDRLCQALGDYKPANPLTSSAITLASGLDDLSGLELSLPRCGEWKPRATAMTTEELKGDDAGGFGWTLAGLPDDKDRKWGEITFSPKNKKLVFRSKLEEMEPRDALYVPLRFSLPDQSASQDRLAHPLWIAGEQVVQIAEPKDGGSLLEVVRGSTVQLATTPALVVSEKLFRLDALKFRISSQATEPALRLKTRDGSYATDIWHATGAWLGSLACERQSVNDGKVFFTIAFDEKTSKRWNDRKLLENGSRKPLPPNDRDWQLDKFYDLVKLILDDDPSPPGNKPVTKDEIEKTFDDWLKSKEPAKNKRPELLGWRTDIVRRLMQPGRSYRSFVEHDVVTSKGPRPKDLQEPPAPGPKASDNDQKTYDLAYKDYQAKQAEIDQKIKAWDEEVRQRGPESRFLVRYLESGDCKDEERRLTLVSLGIDAWIAFRDQADSIQSAAESLRLGESFSASLDLTWHFSDGKQETVPRFLITPTKAPLPTSAQAAPPPSPPSSLSSEPRSSASAEQPSP